MPIIPARPANIFETRTGNQDITGRTFFVQNAGKPYSLQKSVTRGNRYYFEAYPGDHVLGQNDRIRSELQCSTKEAVSGVDVWVSDWVMVQTPYQTGIGQFHQTEDLGPPPDFSGFPPIIWEVEPDGLHIYTASWATQQTGPYPRQIILSAYPFALNVWHSRVMQCRFGWNGDAILNCWLDGIQIVTSPLGLNMGMNNAVGPYYKFGAYGEQNNEQHILAQYANLEMSNTDLSSRIFNPIPVDF